MINNLTGTRWLLNRTIPIAQSSGSRTGYTISFSSNNNTYGYIGYGYYGAGDPTGRLLFGANPGSFSFVYTYIDDDEIIDTWQNEAYRAIEITGGTDATDSTLILWLENNATLLYVPPLKSSFSKISYNAANKILIIDDKYYQLFFTATGSNVTGTSFSNMSLDELGELIIDNTSIHLPIKTTQISFDNGGTYTCANGVTFTMSDFGYLDDYGQPNDQGYWFTNSLGRDMFIWVIEEDNQPYVWETGSNWLGDSEDEAQGWHTTYTSYADDMYVHIVNAGLDYTEVASELGWTTGGDWFNRWQDVEIKFEGIDYVFLHFKRNRTTGYWEIQEES